jgi:hypothetical protein
MFSFFGIPTGTRGRVARLSLLTGAIALMVPVASAAGFPNPARPPLGTAAQFTVLAGSTVTNTGTTVISADTGIGGNLGVSPGSAVTGFPPGLVLAPGTIHAGDATADGAQTDAGTASVNLAGRTPNVVFPPVHDLVGQTLTAGVYSDPTSLALSGALTLNAQGNPDAIFIFQAGSTLVTSTASAVRLIKGAQACNVFWQIGSSATLGASSTFNGTIVASASATVGNSVNIEGRVLAGSGAVTLDNDTIHTPACAPGSGVSALPLLGSWAPAGALGAFILGACVLAWRRRTRPTTPAI